MFPENFKRFARSKGAGYKYSTKTNKDGSFHIKGLPYKTYEIRAIKANYVAGKMEVVMPDKSNRIIEQPIELCPLPPGEGIFVYNDKYIRLSMKPFEVVKSTAEWSNVYIYLWRFAAKDLLDIPPVKSNYLILYGKFRGKYDEYNKMISSGGLALYYLYKSERVRQMLKKNWWERDTQQRSLANDYYSTGVSPGFTVLGQFYLGTGINRESYVNRPHKDNPDFFDGALQTKVFGDVVVVDIRVLPKGYYTIEMPEVDRSYLTNKSDQIQFVLNVE